MIARLLLLAIVLILGGCDAVTALMDDPRAAQRVADAKAIGSACRYGLRSIEDCYALNEKASKAAIFDGWKDMDQYMRENKIDGVPSKVGKELAAPVEHVIEEKATDAAAKDKAGSDSKATPKAKAADKAGN